MTQSLGPTLQTYTLPLTSGAAVPWRYLAASDHVGAFLDADGAVLSTATHATHFTVLPEGDTAPGAGTLALVGTPPTGATQFRLERQTPAVQLWVATPGAEGAATALDRLTLQAQELATRLAGTLRIAGATLGPQVFETGQVPIWSGTGFAAGPTADQISGAAGAAAAALLSQQQAAASATAAALYDGPAVNSFAALAGLTYAMPGIAAGALVLEKSTGTWWTIIGATDVLSTTHLDYTGAGGIKLQLGRQSNLTPQALGYTGANLAADSAAVTLWASLMGNWAMDRPPSPVGIYRHSAAITIEGEANPDFIPAADFQLAADIGSGSDPWTWTVHFKVRNCDKWSNRGYLRVSGADHTGDTGNRAAYADRRADIGFAKQNCRHADLGNLTAFGYRVAGCFFYDRSNMPALLGTWIDSHWRLAFGDFTSCGAFAGDLSVTTTASVTNNGTNGNAQLSTLAVAAIPAILYVGAQLRVPSVLTPSGFKLHKVMGINRPGLSLTVFPAIRPDDCPSGTVIDVWQGWGFFVAGNDNNSGRAKFRATDCASPFLAAAAQDTDLDVYAMECGDSGQIGTVEPLSYNSTTTALSRATSNLNLRLMAEFAAEGSGTLHGLVFNTISGTGIRIHKLGFRRFEPSHQWQNTTDWSEGNRYSLAPGVVEMIAANGVSIPLAQGGRYVDGLNMGSATDNLVSNGPPAVSTRMAAEQYAGFQLLADFEQALAFQEVTVTLLRDASAYPGGNPIWEDLVVALAPGDVTAYGATIAYRGEAASTVTISGTTYQGIRVARVNGIFGLRITGKFTRATPTTAATVKWTAEPIGFTRGIPAAVTDTTASIAAGASYDQADMAAVKALLASLTTAVNATTLALREKT